MTFKRTIIIAIAFILLFSNTSFASSDKDILVQENYKLRSEIIRLKILLSGKKADKIPVLLYHHILPEADIEEYNWDDNGSIISLEDFKAQMTYLYENNYHTATMAELELFIKGELELPDKTVAITFDDGYLSNRVYAYPVLKEYGQRATIFMGFKTITQSATELFPEELQYMSYTDNCSDVFDYESHTFNMHIMEDDKALLETSSFEEIKQDLEISKAIFNSKYIAYPFGRYNETTLEVIEELGFRLGFTVDFGYVTSELPIYELPRIIIYPGTDMEKFISYLG